MNINVLRNFIKDTWWMAKRYADGRSTTVPHVFNCLIGDLVKHGYEDLLVRCGNESIFARDGMYGEWDPERKMFKGWPPDGKDMAHHEDAGRDLRENDLRYARWVHKKTGKSYYVITQALDVTNGENEGRKVVVYSDELYTYVRDLDEFMEKFELAPR